MIYCPHCSKPSVTTEGACPHCGQELSGVAPAKERPPTQKLYTHAGAPAQSTGESLGLADLDLGAQDASGLDVTDDLPAVGIKAPAAAAEDPASPLVSDIASSPQNGNGDRAPGSGLDLAFDKRKVKEEKIVSSTIKRESERTDVAAVARFGVPGAGVVGAVRYWLKVRARLKQLDSETTGALKDLDERRSKFVVVTAELGWAAHKAGVRGGDIDAVVSKALVAQGDLEGLRRKLAMRVDEHRKKKLAIEHKKNEADAEAEPLRVREEQDRRALDAVQLEKQKVERQYTDGQMDKQRLTDEIGKKQELYVSPDQSEAAKEVLFREVSALEEQRGTIEQRCSALQAELTRLHGPLQEAQKRHDMSRQILSQKMEVIGQIRRAAAQKLSEFSELEEAMKSDLKAQEDACRQVWSDAGGIVLDKHTDHPKLAPRVPEATALKAAYDDAQRRVELLNLALTSYDHGTVGRAKKIVAIAAGLVVAAIILINVI